jgi:hypothetical protein
VQQSPCRNKPPLGYAYVPYMLPWSYDLGWTGEWATGEYGWRILAAACDKNPRCVAATTSVWIKVWSYLSRYVLTTMVQYSTSSSSCSNAQWKCMPSWGTDRVRRFYAVLPVTYATSNKRSTCLLTKLDDVLCACCCMLLLLLAYAAVLLLRPLLALQYGCVAHGVAADPATVCYAHMR